MVFSGLFGVGFFFLYMHKGDFSIGLPLLFSFSVNMSMKVSPGCLHSFVYAILFKFFPF